MIGYVNVFLTLATLGAVLFMVWHGCIKKSPPVKSSLFQGMDVSKVFAELDRRKNDEGSQ